MEGFDPLEFVGDSLYLGDKKFGNTYLHTFVNALWQRISVFNKLRSEYDIIYIDLFDSKLSIQANARLFESAIELINQEKASCGSTEKNIVMGQSMGGLIARYGLKEMENMSKIHDVSILFCQDTPHLGAHVPLGILQGMNGLLRFYHDKWLFGRLDLGDFKSKIAPVLYSNAARQMLINYVDNNGNVDNSFHNAWQKELTQMGYPQGDKGYKIRIVSISNGQTPVVDCQKPYIYADGKVSPTFLSDVLMGFLTPFAVPSTLGIALQDWQTFVLGLLPGSSTLVLHFEANPIGYQFQRSVCSMYLRYVKKYLWLVNIRRTVFSYQRDYPPSMINYDRMPGSYYEYSKGKGPSASSDQASRWAQLFVRYNLTVEFENKLMFIPTVSSLDIGEGRVELTKNDYETKYSMDFRPAPPKHTPFDAFYITDGSTYHTSFEPAMLDWMLEQMKVTVNGPEVATDGSKYTIQNNTKNYGVTWSSSDESVAVIDNSGTLSMKKFGVITITASCVINNVTTKFHKKIMVGFPPFILEWHIGQGDYIVSARAIDPKAEPFLKYLKYEWKLKNSHVNSSSDWKQSSEPWIKTQSYSKHAKETFYMRAFNAEGVRANPIYLDLDVTSPIAFEPSTFIYRVGPHLSPEMIMVCYFPNPQYQDQEALKTNEEFRISRVETAGRKCLLDRSSCPYIGNNCIPLSQCFQDGFFSDWYAWADCIGYASPKVISTVLCFINTKGRVICIKPIPVVYVRYRYMF